MSRYVLGLDIGITSVGYGVIDVDNDLFVDYGGFSRLGLLSM